jgi:4-hydroxyphenylacetate decarboxylase small subunit
MENNCKDCKFYLPVDVFKGLCKLEKNSIFPDDLSCSKFECLAKCKYCSKYISEKEHLGKCIGFDLVYPDMNASKCAAFEWNSQN